MAILGHARQRKLSPEHLTSYILPPFRVPLAEETTAANRAESKQAKKNWLHHPIIRLDFIYLNNEKTNNGLRGLNKHLLAFQTFVPDFFVPRTLSPSQAGLFCPFVLKSPSRCQDD